MWHCSVTNYSFIRGLYSFYITIHTHPACKQIYNVELLCERELNYFRIRIKSKLFFRVGLKVGRPALQRREGRHG